MENTSKIWDTTIGKHIDMPEEMEKFLEDIDLVCKKYNLSISHEDGHGSFVIEEYDDWNIKWLFNAFKHYKDRT